MSVRPSRRAGLLTILLAAGGVRALALCPLPPAAFAALAAVVLGLAAHELLAVGRGGSLVLDAEGHWHLDGFGRAPFSGRLARSGYRGARALALVVIDDEAHHRHRAPRRRPLDPRALARSPRRRVAVHRDSVTTEDFSFLHLQLAFPPSAPDGGAR